MKLLRDARTLRTHAVASLKRAMATFNSYDDEGRPVTVLLHLQHASEMLLKAVLVQNRAPVFDKKSGKSIGFERCLGICQAQFGLTAEQARIMRAIDALRDAAQHWYVVVSEELLFMHTKALVTAFDEYLKRALDSDLHSYIPARALPVATKPLGDIELLIDREFSLIAELLQPGRRQRDEARGRIRALLAMEALVADEVDISERDIDRIEKVVRMGEEIGKVFPRLIAIATSSSGEGPTAKLHFSKKEGAPIRYASGDDIDAAGTVREVDLRRKFHLQKAELAKVLGITPAQSKALRDHLGIDEDPDCHHVFAFGKMEIGCFSDNARNKMRAAIAEGVDVVKLAKAARARGRKA